MMQLTLFRAFEQLADTPSGVAKLRELTLRLAVRGRLVPQLEKDGTADALVGQLEDERQRLIADGLMRENRRPANGEDHAPFEVPATWRWLRMCDVGRIVGGGTPSSTTAEYWADDGVAWLTPADLYRHKKKYISRGKRDISSKGLGSSSAQLMPAGTVVFSSRAPIGYVAIAEQPLATNQGFKSCVPFVDGISEFLYYYLKCVGPEIDANASGTTFKEVSGAEFAAVWMPLPPLAEQARIVAKVDELMALCDELEARQTTRNEARRRLHAATLHHVTAARSPAEPAAHWSRLRTHFDPLHATPDSIPALRQTILTLAVNGQLATRNPSDEPATEALSRLEAKGGNLAVRRSVPFNAQAPQFVLEECTPVGWAVESTARLLHLGAILDVKDGNHGANHPKVSEFTEAGLPFITAAQVSAGGQIDYDGAYKLSGEPLARLRVGFAKPEDVIYTHKGSVGRVAICTRECVLSPQTTYYRTDAGVLNNRYLRLFLLSGSYRRQVDEVKGQTTRDFVSIKAQYEFFLRIPPIAEQKRIVAKVEQLLALCDELETQLKETEGRRVRLLKVAVTELLNQRRTGERK